MRHEQRDGARDGQRTGQVEHAIHTSCVVSLDQGKGQDERCACERDIDEKHGLPTESARQDAAQQDADHKAGCTGAAPDAQGAVAIAALCERGVDESEGAGEDKSSAKSLNRTRSKLNLGARGKSAAERGHGLEREAGDEHSTSPEQICGATAEQQEAARSYRVCADHGL